MTATERQRLLAELAKVQYRIAERFGDGASSQESETAYLRAAKPILDALARDRKARRHEPRHFVGGRHPRDPKGQWTEHGPGGTKSKNPIKALSTGKAPNGVRWQAVPDDSDAIDLGSYVTSKSGVSGQVVGVSKYSDGTSNLTVLDDEGLDHKVDFGDLVQHAPRPPRVKKPTEQLIEERRGPRPKRARSSSGDVGGNGMAPYLMDDLPPLQPGNAQVEAVFKRHQEFIPNISKMVIPIVANHEQMRRADTGYEERGATGVASGLAVRPAYPSPFTTAMVHDKWLDDEAQVEAHRRSGYSAVTNGRTYAEVVAAHEIGHGIDFHLTDDERLEVFGALADALDLPAPAGSDRQTLDSWVQEHQPELAKKISIYSTTNSLEILAEIWAEYALSTKSRPPWPWTEAAGDVMRKAAATK